VNARTTLTAILTTAVLTLTGCGSTETTPEYSRTTTVAPKPDLTPDDLTGHTRDTFELTWAISGEPERDMYCASVALLGPDAAAEEMRVGAGYDDSLNWTVMAELLQAECARR